jgi:hypothetical protein
MTSIISFIVTSLFLTNYDLEEYKYLRFICVELHNFPVAISAVFRIRVS